MARPVEVRTAKWAGRMYGESLSPIMARRLVAATAKYTSAAEIAFAVEAVVRDVLNSMTSGVAVYAIPAYLAAGRQMAALLTRFSGETVAVECAVVIAKWTARGLTEAVLEEIRDAFGIAEPIEP